ncbi:MAG: glycosyltransferase family 39 protein [Planctomycetota bacterium]
MGPDRKREILIVLLAAAALGMGLWHGLPNVYVPDTHMIRNALGMAKTMNLWPPAGMYSTYPYLLSYLLLPVYAATFLIGRVFGAYASPEEFGARVVEDPTIVYIEARIMVALFGLMAVLYLYRTARRLGFSLRVATGTALLLALNPLFVQLGHHARPWIPLVAAVTFTLYHSAGIALHARRRDYLLAALGAGLGFAMHQVGGALVLLPLCAHFACLKASALKGKQLLRLGLLIGVMAGVAFFLGYGHMAFAGKSLDAIPTDQENIDLGGQKLLITMFSGARAMEIATAFFGYDPAGSTLGLIGLLLGLFAARGFRGLRFALFVFCGFLSCFFLLYANSHIRYMLPFCPALALGAGYLAARAGDRKPGCEALILIPLVLFSSVQTARLDLLLCRTDTRDLARDWIERNIPAGTRIAAEGYTAPLRPDRASLLFLRDEAGVWLKQKESLILEGRLRKPEGPEYYLIPLERFWQFRSYWPHQYLLGGDRPIAAFLDDLKTEWIMLYERWPEQERHAPMTEYLDQKKAEGPIFSPTRTPHPREASLPTDMDFPLFALWYLDRPGPIIKLYKTKAH